MSFLKRAASVSHSSWWWNPTIDQLLAIKNADFDNIVAWLDHNIDKKQTQQNNNNNVNTSNNNNNSGFTPGSSETRISLTIPQIHHCFLNAKEKSATGHPPTHLVIKLLYELELQFIKLFNVDSKGSSQRFKQYNSFIPTNENTSMLHWSMCSIAKNRIKDRFESVFQVDDTGAFKQIFSVYDHLFGKDSDQRDHLATQLNSSIKDNPSLKWEIITYYYDIVSHFYVFIELMYHVLRVKMPSSSTVTSPTKNNSSSSSNGNGKSGGSNSDSIAKKLKTYRANIESQMNGKSFSSHYLRVDESKDNYLLFDHTGNITMMHSGLNSKKPITKQLEKITVRNRLYDDTKEISKYLLLIADDLDLYFQSPFIPISGVLRLYDVLLETKIRVTDPPIKGLRLKMSDLKELEPIGEGGCASVFAVEAPNTPELANVPMVLKKFKIPYHGDDSGVRNINKTIDKSVYKFKREASFLS
ncbi:hypothetical protein PPL_08721 [Heterostelium album PN500]|uniref:Uncharacterized protein n=1 Tax=Heterostelium pallidum (strain ATCC 26659 / Pp 5 / PN500) TaxID=670386 RepID=D3BJJ4_HETP5|nr:hypothetical protein PPL_08721 [Heterostelium album PN500]EFA78074.1 hypothetical protein PPL_08721 [Heterostelium album PN500]|eukprot:XP_020430201.1 hypothetical protein PPL_08721 [Heterostelium album PN500]